MSAKQEILRRIAGALADVPQAPEVPRAYRRTSSLNHAVTLEMLEDRLLDYKANVYHETAESLPARMAELLGEATRIVAPDGLDRAWLAAREANRTFFESSSEVLPTRELNDTVSAVVTSSTVSCAETGTIFLTGRANEGRRAISLVPDHHVCVVPVDTVVELIPEALARVERTAPITMISGPSATSDIELERVEGVHGPRRLDVILLGEWCE